MKRILTAAILLLTSYTLSAQLYNAGERLDYRVAYKAKLVPNTEMATVTVETTIDTLNGNPVYRVMGLGKIMPEYRWFFNLEDRYDIFVDTLTLRTQRFESDIREGDYTFRSYYNYDWDNKKVHTWAQSRQRTPRTKTMELTPRSMDAVSLYYNLRTVPDSIIKEGFARDLEMVLEDTVRYLSFRYDGREVKKVRGLGKFNTIKFRCKIATSDGFAFTDGTEFMVWISDDRNKIPLYIESPIKVGSVCAYLSSYEGLRYPMDCFIKK